MKRALIILVAPFFIFSVSHASLEDEQLDSEQRFIENEEAEIQKIETQIAARKALIRDRRGAFEKLQMEWEFLSGSQRRARINTLLDSRPVISMKHMIERSSSTVVAQKRRVGLGSVNRKDQAEREARQERALGTTDPKERRFSRGGGSRQAQKRITQPRYRRSSRSFLPAE
ncbi:MAG TPA: hypothetical protein VIT68_03770 [Candidatus Gracilibacteria bacterium]